MDESINEMAERGNQEFFMIISKDDITEGICEYCRHRDDVYEYDIGITYDQGNIEMTASLCESCVDYASLEQLLSMF